MAGLAASGSENPLRDGHTTDVFGAGFTTDEDDFLAAFGPLFSFLRGEDDFADGSTGNGIDAGSQDFQGQGFPVDLGIDHGIEEPFNVLGFDAENGFLSGDELFGSHIDSDSKGGGGGALAGARLEHVELAILDGKLHVLHVAIVLLKFYSNFLKLRVNSRHDLLHFA